MKLAIAILGVLMMGGCTHRRAVSKVASPIIQLDLASIDCPVGYEGVAVLKLNGDGTATLGETECREIRQTERPN